MNAHLYIYSPGLLAGCFTFCPRNEPSGFWTKSSFTDELRKAVPHPEAQALSSLHRPKSKTKGGGLNSLPELTPCPHPNPTQRQSVPHLPSASFSAGAEGCSLRTSAGEPDSRFLALSRSLWELALPFSEAAGSQALRPGEPLL